MSSALFLRGSRPASTQRRPRPGPSKLNMELKAPKETSEAQPFAPSGHEHLLQIIAGTTALMEDIWTGKYGSDKYVAMLRARVQQDASITATLVAESAAGATKRRAARRRDRVQPFRPARTSPPQHPRGR